MFIVAFIFFLFFEYGSDNSRTIAGIEKQTYRKCRCIKKHKRLMFIKKKKLKNSVFA